MPYRLIPFLVYTTSHDFSKTHLYTYRYAHIGIDTGGVCGMHDSHMADVVASVASVTPLPPSDLKHVLVLHHIAGRKQNLDHLSTHP